jgi:Rod binding domain-containing protein
MIVPTDGGAVPSMDAAPQPAAAPVPPARDAADQAKLQKAAGDFESILLASMWKSMKQSFGSSETETDPAHGTLDDWSIEIMSGAVGRAGGLGIGKMILQHLEPALPAQAEETPVDQTAQSIKRK